MIIDYNKDKKTLTLEHESDKIIILFNLCWSLPLGLKLFNKKIKFMGKCWYWAEFGELFCEVKALWFGPFGLQYGRMLVKGEKD